MSTSTCLQINMFEKKIYNFYQKNKRMFAWRENITPYKIFISEVMLQQTQTARVVPKFEQWIVKFPNFKTLASASMHEVLSAWQGLGYNRRGVCLYKAAQIIVQDFDGQLPSDPKILQTLPGIGPNTAGSICAFAFNLPVVFIETNIRTVFLHEFFQGQLQISDQELLPLIEKYVDRQNPREWYYALMDYGVYLKKELKVSNKNSKHYTRQSKFIGSRRQVRGAVIRILTKMHAISINDLFELIVQELPENRHDVSQVVEQLVLEGLIKKDQDTLRL
jgi:A/G-specific adenine glycosylase